MVSIWKKNTLFFVVAVVFVDAFEDDEISFNIYVNYLIQLRTTTSLVHLLSNDVPFFETIRHDRCDAFLKYICSESLTVYPTNQCAQEF